MMQNTVNLDSDLRVGKVKERLWSADLQKIPLIRDIDRYVDRISGLYDNKDRAIELVRNHVTGFPDESYSLEALRGVRERVQRFYIEQRQAYERRRVNRVPNSALFLEQMFDDSRERPSRSENIAQSSQKPSLNCYEEPFGW